MTLRLHITALTGNGMTTEYRALKTPHMGSEPWVPETVQAAKEQAAYAKGLEEAIAILQGMRATPGVLHQPTINLAVSALSISATKARALAREDGE